MKFDKKVVFITGAASGIGRATAQKLAAAGARLYLTDIDSDGLARVSTDIAAATGRRVSGQVIDVADPEACRAAVDDAVARYGRLDVLCNMAGTLRTGHLADFSVADWQRLLGVNLSGVFYLCQAALPQLIDSAGCIVNMASSAGLSGQAYNAAYCASKGGVVMLTKALAAEFAGRGVRVNAVCPGAVRTPMASQFVAPAGADKNLLKRMLAPGRCIAEPEQIADAVAFLAGPSAHHITGITLPIDGGEVAVGKGPVGLRGSSS